MPELLNLFQLSHFPSYENLLEEAHCLLASTDDRDFYFEKINPLLAKLEEGGRVAGADPDFARCIASLQARVTDINKLIERREQQHNCKLTLEFCVKIRDVAGAQALLFRGDDINHADRRGITALHIASRNGDVEMTRMLLKQPHLEINMKTERSNKTAFELAESEEIREMFSSMQGNSI